MGQHSVLMGVQGNYFNMQCHTSNKVPLDGGIERSPVQAKPWLLAVFEMPTRPLYSESTKFEYLTINFIQYTLHYESLPGTQKCSIQKLYSTLGLGDMA